MPDGPEGAKQQKVAESPHTERSVTTEPVVADRDRLLESFLQNNVFSTGTASESGRTDAELHSAFPNINIIVDARRSTPETKEESKGATEQSVGEALSAREVSAKGSRPNAETMALIRQVQQSKPDLLGPNGNILSPEERDILNRRYHADGSGQSLKEIGEALGMSPHGVLGLEQRGVARLRLALGYKAEDGHILLPPYKPTSRGRKPNAEAMAIIDRIRHSKPDLLGPNGKILSPEEREVIRRRYPVEGDGQSLKEIGEALGLKAPTVMKYEQEAIARLRLALGDSPEGGNIVLPPYVERARYSSKGAAKLIEQVRKTKPSLLTARSGILSTKERSVINARFPSGNKEGQTIEQIAEQLGTSAKYVNKIEQRAVSRLRGVLGHSPTEKQPVLGPHAREEHYSFKETARLVSNIRQQKPNLLTDKAANLSPEELKIINGRYSSEGDPKKTIKDLSVELGMSNNKIIKLERQAVQKLHEAMERPTQPSRRSKPSSFRPGDAHGRSGSPMRDGEPVLTPHQQRLANEIGINPTLLQQRLNPGIRHNSESATANPRDEILPRLTLSSETIPPLRSSPAATKAASPEGATLLSSSSKKTTITPDEIIHPAGRDTLRERYNQELAVAHSRTDKTTSVRTDAPRSQPTAKPMSDTIKNSATSPLVLLKVAQSLAHAARGDMDKAQFHAKEALAIGGTNLAISTTTDVTRHAALAKIAKDMAREAVPTTGQKVAVATVKNLGSLVGEGFVVYNALHKETGAGTAAELGTGTTEVLATTGLSTLLLQQGALKGAGPIAGVMATGDLIRFSGNLIATINGTERPTPSIIQQTSQAVFDLQASRYIDKAQTTKIDRLMDDLRQGPPVAPKAAQMYRQDYPERLVTGTDLEATYRAFGKAKQDSAAILRSFFSSYDNEHSNLKQYFDQLARYEDAAELHIAGAKRYESAVPGLHIPGSIANPPVIDEKKYPRLAALEQQLKQAAPGMTFRERYDHIRESTLSTHNPVNMIDMPKEREALFKEFQAFTLEKYIPYQVALIASHSTFVQNERTLQTAQQQSAKELTKKSWEMVQQACNELGMVNNPDFQAMEAAYKQKPTEENLQQVIDYLMRAVQAKQASVPPRPEAA